jgi:hypothetical protein
MPRWRSPLQPGSGRSSVNADRLQPRDARRTTIEAKLVRKLSDNTTIGELVGLGGYGFNAVRRKVRFAPTAAIPFTRWRTPAKRLS